MGLCIEKNLIKTYVLQHILKYTMPIYLIHLVGVVCYFFNAYFISYLGKNQIAAFAIANVYFVLINIFMTAILNIISITLSKYNVVKYTEIINHIIFNGFILTLTLSAVGTILLWNGMRTLVFLGQSPELALYADRYFHYAALGITPALLNSLIAQICIGLGKPGLNIIQCWIRLPIVISLSYLLIIKNHQGLAGASIALLVTNLLILPVIFFLLLESDIWGYLCLKGRRLWSWSIINQLFTNGVYIGFQSSGEVGAVLCILFFMGQLSKDALVSFQIISQYSAFLLMGSLSISQGLSNTISACVGYGEKKYTKSYTYTASCFLLAIITIFSLCYLLLPIQLMGFFINVTDINNTPLVQLTKSMMLVSIPILFMDGLRNILTGSLRGLGKAKTPMIIDTFSLWLVGLPLGYLFGLTLGYGPIGLRVGFMFGYLLSTINLLAFYRKTIASSVRSELCA